MPSNKEAFVQRMQEHKAIIYKICRSYCEDRNAREDLAQEIVYNLWKAYKSYKPAYPFTTWMYRIALNVAISFYRKERKYSVHQALDEDLIVFEDLSVENKEAEGKIRLLEKFIHELGEIDKSIMLLYLDDKSYKEMAGIVGISETNIATKINRIKTKLKSNFALIQNM